MKLTVRNLVFLAPSLIFLAAGVGFYVGLDSERNPSEIPSQRLDDPAPALVLGPVPGAEVPGIAADSLSGGQVTVLNFWASWCAPCRIEHPALMALSEQPGLQIVGVDYKDNAAKAVDFLAELGNPFDLIGFDAKGRSGIDWGITGVPETFIVDREGIVRYRHVGPIDDTILQERMLPLIAELSGS